MGLTPYLEKQKTEVNARSLTRHEQAVETNRRHHDLGYHRSDPAYHYWCHLCVKQFVDTNTERKTRLETILHNIGALSILREDERALLEEVIRHEILRLQKWLHDREQEAQWGSIY